MSSAWTPERREKQRQIAKQLVEQGKFGGAGRGQGRKRIPTASERVAERTKDEGDTIFEMFMDVIKNGSDRDRIAAGTKLLEVERQEEQRREQEEANFATLRREELLEGLLTKLTDLEDAGVIPGLVEGEAELVDDEGTAPDVQGSRPALEEGDGSAGASD